MRWASRGAALWGLGAMVCAGCLATSEPPEEGGDPVPFMPDQGAPPGGPDMRTPRTVEMGYVLQGCDPVAQDCADQQGRRHKCVLGPDGQTSCIPDQEQRGHEEACEGINQCAGGLVCVNWQDARGQRCERLCLAEGGASCVGEEVCRSGVSGSQLYGLCEVRPVSCDLVAQDCVGGDCVLRVNPSTGRQEPLCGRAGQLAPGEPCEQATQSCQAGSICVRLAPDEQARCARACRPPMGEEPDPCQAPARCVGETSAGVAFCRQSE